MMCVKSIVFKLKNLQDKDFLPSAQQAREFTEIREVLPAYLGRTQKTNRKEKVDLPQ